MNDLFQIPQYSIPLAQKEALLLPELDKLTKHHQEHCLAYARILKSLDLPLPPYRLLKEIPYLPVNLFKNYELLSIPPREIYKILLSSGTTQMKPSKIYLDSKTSQLQTAALASIMTHFLGQKRLPMLIVDGEDVIKDPKMFSARGAAYLGMLNFGRDPFYMLDKNMEIKHDALKNWLFQQREKPILIFGLTFMVWKYLLDALPPGTFSLPSAILIHTGGWKKLQERSVNNEDFKARAEAVAGIRQCHNFYGFVEQIGSVYMECERGVLHTPNFAEVIVRNPVSWKEADIGVSGVIQALSLLPWSYPGHSILTEDLGQIVGIDDCLCGRKGKTFKVLGRIPRAEPRGCSDVIDG